MSTVTVRNVVIGEGIPKICVPVVAQTAEEILADAAQIRSLPIDVVEWRADWFAEAFGPKGKPARTDEESMRLVLDTAAGLRKILGDIPLLYTFRTLKEGGEREILTEAYLEMNVRIAAGGSADLIDLELLTAGAAMAETVNRIHACGGKVVASSHDFYTTPARKELVRRMLEMQLQGADIAKIAVMPQKKADVLELLAATLEMQEQYPQTPVITMSMSAKGVVSRLAGETFGSALTFGAAKKASAPGQIRAEDLKRVLDIIHEAN